jgi:hypothetical protein
MDIPKEWLIFEILSILKYRIDLQDYYGPLGDIANEQLIFKDNRGNRQTIREFTQGYEKSQDANRPSMLFLYFSKPNLSNFHSEIFGDMKLLEEVN